MRRLAAGPFTPHPLTLALALAFAPLNGALAQTAPADPPEAGKLQTVTVTAERRAEDIKEVPISVFTLGGEQLDVLNSSGQDVRVLSSRVPSLNIESSFGRAFPRFYIRGYGNTDFRANASQPVSLIYDEVVQENPLLKGFPMFDLDRIEVLAGPQGTLFGRNTPAGVVKFDSAAPRIGAKDGYASLSYGTYGTANAEAATSVPLGETLAVRASVLWQHRDDWVHNTDASSPTQDLEGYDDKAARLQLLYKPSADFSALFNVHSRDITGSARLFRGNIIKPGTNDLIDGFDPEKIAIDGANRQHIATSGANARLTWELGDYRLHSITAFETVHSYSRGDIDGTAGPYVGFGPAFVPGQTTHFPSETAGALTGHAQYTQEFRVESKYKGPLNWQAGVYYFDEDYVAESYSYDTLGGGTESHTGSDRQKNTSWAAFGSLRYDVSPAFNVRAGLRYTSDKKELTSDASLPIVTSAGTSANTSDSKVNGDLSGSYKLSSTTNVYARIASGFRGSSVQPASQFAGQSVAGPEDTVSYEAGVKADLFDKRARVSFDVFHYDVKNLQLTAVGGASNANILLNAKKATGQGFEFSLDAYVTDNLLLGFNGSLNDTKIKDPNLKVAGCSGGCTPTDPSDGAGNYFIDGNPLPQAPKWIANVNVRYSIPASNGGEFYVYTDWSYRSKINFFLYESKEFTGKSLLEGGLRVGYLWGNGKYEAAIFGRNITNRIVTVGGIDFDNLTGFINEPRTWGAQFRASF